MNQSTHTPGPWEAFPAKTQDGEETISIRGDGTWIATMDVVSTGGPFVLPESGPANARLIAAAPDLLAVCETLRRAIAWSHTEDRMDDAEQLAMIDAAIAKAEGW